MFPDRNTYLTSSWVTSYYPTESAIVGTADLCVTVAELKVPLNKYDDKQDGYLLGLISAVQEQVERFIGKDATVRERITSWRMPKGTVSFAYGPVGAITEVVAISMDGTETVLAPTDYVVVGQLYKSITFNRPFFGITIKHASGYATTPEPIKQAIIQECMFQFKNRNDPSLPARVSVNNLCLEARHLVMGYYSYGR